MNKANEIVSALEAIVSGSDTSLDMQSAWARLLSSAPNRSEFILAMSAMLAKFEDVEEEILAAKLSEAARGLYMKAIGTLRSYADPFALHGRRISDLGAQREQINILHLAADTLPQVAGPDVPLSTLESLILSLEEILAGLDEYSLDDPLRQLLKVQLSTLIMGLRSYGTLGPSGLTRIYGAVFAELVRLYPTARAAPDTSKSAFSNAIRVVKKIGAVVVWAGAVVGGANTLIGDGSEIWGFIAPPDAGSADASADAVN
jgi:hypothetical protein